MYKEYEKFQIIGEKNILLRPILLEDCNDIYLSWLNNKEVNQYLETRWEEQTIRKIKRFVYSQIESSDTYLFAIIDENTKIDGKGRHIGNIKIGPINRRYNYADISYFIGEIDAWGKGYATEAIKLITKFGFEKLKLYRCQAGVFANNAGSRRALEKAQYKYEGSQKKQLINIDGNREDHIYYGIVLDDWKVVYKI